MPKWTKADEFYGPDAPPEGASVPRRWTKAAAFAELEAFGQGPHAEMAALAQALRDERGLSTALSALASAVAILRTPRPGDAAAASALDAALDALVIAAHVAK